jgi:Protein of unknown function (DUF3738)
MRLRNRMYVGLIWFAVAFVSAQTVRPVFSDFEVATVKPSGPDDPEAGRFIRMESAQRFEVRNYTVNGLIAAAYDVTPRAISGGPAWSESERYNIIALAPGDLRPTYDEQMVMLRKLLSDRFKLAFHREEKVFSLYELTVGSGGSRITSSKSPFDEASNVTSTLFPAASGGIDHALLPAHNITMREFASVRNVRFWIGQSWTKQGSRAVTISIWNGGQTTASSEANFLQGLPIPTSLGCSQRSKNNSASGSPLPKGS